MASYHVNPKTGAPGVCRAKVKCRFGDFEKDHYDSAADARLSFENAQGIPLSLQGVARDKSPMSLLSKNHQDIQEGSDGFYNTVGVTDEDAINAIADYHYYRYLSKISPQGEKQAVLANAMKAKRSLLSTNAGSAYKGWEWDEMSIIDGDDTPQTPTSFHKAVKKSPEALASSDEVRVNTFSGGAVDEYANASRAWIRSLSPREHNAVTYWTSAGASVAGSIAHGGSNPWGIQSSDAEDDNYFNHEEYLDGMDSALSQAPEMEATVLYRGLNNDVVGDKVKSEVYKDGEKPGTASWLAENYAVGSEVTFSLPQSASRNSNSAMSFCDSNIMFEVLAKKAGAPGIVSAWGLSEGEYILPRTTSYKVRNVLHDVTYESRQGRERGFIVVQLEQVL